jgi:predicted SprT family Zn-dependent metalloprotease
MKSSVHLDKNFSSSLHSITLELVSAPRKGTPAPELTLFAADRLNTLGLHALSQSISVLWNKRMRSTAGLAYPSSNQIVLNPQLSSFGWREVERTLLHELAHLVAQHRAGRRRIAPHGPEWRKACADLGISNEARCHDLPLPRRELSRSYVYRCPNCQSTVERVRPLRRAAACMACCKQYSRGRYDEKFQLTRTFSAPPALSGVS